MQTLPTTAHEFVKFMEEIWDMSIEPTEDGILLTGHPDYWRYQDAVKTAKECGAKKLYGSWLDGKPSYHFEFSNGSRVSIHTDGAGCRVINRHRK